MRYSIKKRRKFFLVTVSIISTVCFLFATGVVFAGFFPSFEVYFQNKYPTVTSTNVFLENNSVTITVYAYDESGILLVKPKIQDPQNQGQYLAASCDMQNIGSDGTDEIFTCDLSVLGWQEGTYYVDIEIVDSFFNNSMLEAGQYKNVGHFTIGNPVLQSIEITKQPTQLVYTVGDLQLDLSGMEVTGHYNTGDQIISNSSLATDGFDSSTVTASQTITVSYGGFSDTFDISIQAGSAILDHISIAIEPTQLVYTVGDSSLSLSGMQVVAYYNDSSISTLYNGDLAFAGFDSSQPARIQVITVTYQGKSDTFKITIFPVCTNPQTNHGATICIDASALNPSTMTGFTATPSSTSAGTTVTLTATLSLAGPGETVLFRDYDNSLLLGSAITDVSGTAVFEYQPAFNGMHTIQAVYDGNGQKGYLPSYMQTNLTITGNCATNHGATICIDAGISDITPPGQ
jgi:hypothetical protein